MFHSITSYLQINGENVIRASHEHVVHLIRSSSDVLTLKVVTVTHTERAADWTLQPGDAAVAGHLTLPNRKKTGECGVDF